MAAILNSNMAAINTCFSISQESVELDTCTSFQMRINPSERHPDILQDIFNMTANLDSIMDATIKRNLSLLLEQTLFFFVRY